MADETKDANDAGGGKKKTLLLVLGIVVIEAALIVGGMMLLSGGPRESVADAGRLDPEEAELQRIVEILVLEDRLPNARRGVPFVYESKISIQVRNRHREQVEQELGQFSNEIEAEIFDIWREADPRFFNEPGQESLRRQVRAMMHERFGTDPESGEPIIQKVVIKMGLGIRVDS